MTKTVLEREQTKYVQTQVKLFNYGLFHLVWSEVMWLGVECEASETTNSYKSKMIITIPEQDLRCNLSHMEDCSSQLCDAVMCSHSTDLLRVVRQEG